MLKEKFKQFFVESGMMQNRKFEVVDELQAADILGGCGSLQSCGTYSGVCGSLYSCGPYTDTCPTNGIK